MLEDNKDDAMMIERVLRKDNLSFIKECVDTREEFDESIKRFQPDVILSDHGLPQFNSREALKIALKESSSSPFILVTGTMTDEFAISILRDGADDYILKSNLSRLPLAIRRAIKERRLEQLKREARHALRKQNSELLKVNQELDNFVYSVSHNLKGPLASVTGLLNISKKMDKSPEMDEVHAMMLKSVLQLDDTLKDILVYSKNARNDIESQKIEWLTIINETWQKLQYLHTASRVIKSIDVTTTEEFISDPHRLQVIFSNLLSNAIQYCTKKTQPEININVTANSDEAIIIISDNGIGISEDVLPKVCNMFYRGSEHSHGAGLGLFIVKEVVNKLKGTLTITSDRASGTIVTVAIPQSKAAGDPV